MTDKQPNETITQALDRLSAMAGYHQNKARIHREKAEEHDEHLQTCECYIAALQATACPACRGWGGRNVWYAQDDCKFEKCTVCEGDGSLRLDKFEAVIEEATAEKGQTDA